jgi:hypothetical protein
MNAKDVTTNTEYIKIMSVGEPGTGKSILGSTFPTPGFVFDFANSIISYRGLDFDYEQYPLSPLGWNKAEKDVVAIIKAVREGKYQSVVVDDLSAMTAVCMERALQLDSKRSPTGGPVWNIHYSMVRNLMEGRLKQIMALECNIHFIAHLHVIQDQETGNITGVEPMLTGALPVVIPGYFDEVYYHTTKREGGDTKWLIQTVPIGYNRARSRFSGKLRLLPDLLPNDYNEIMAYVTGKKKKERKEVPKQTTKIETATKTNYETKKEGE